MISPKLIALLRCPTCTAEVGAANARLAPGDADELRCGRCGRRYRLVDGVYADLMPQQQAGLDHESKYVAHMAEFEATLDYREIGPPLLGAGVRNRLLRKLLQLKPGDRVLELGSGNGRFLLYNRELVGMSVGIDPAPLFADRAVQEIDLVRGDARLLPFPDNSFSKAWSIDVLEHLPAADIARYLAEAYRVLAPGGRIFVFSNTRERGRFDLLVSGSRHLADWLARRGAVDPTRDLLRKSDHVKALETWPDVEAAVAAAGFELRRAVFWNGVFQSFIENVLMRLAERAAIATRGRVTRDTGAGSSPRRHGGTEDENINNLRVSVSPWLNPVAAPSTSEDAVAARTAVRGRLARGGPMLKLLQALTELMWLDIVLFGRYRTGPYFLLLRKPLVPSQSEHAPGNLELSRS